MNIIKKLLRTFLMVAFFMLSACKPAVYTVTYHPNGGSQPTAITFDGKSEILLATSTRVGYLFEGWYLDDSTFIQEVSSTTFVTTPIKENIDLYAKWTVASFALVYEENGGPTITDQTYAYGASIDIGPNPVREGHSFGGWYADALLETPFSLTTMPAQSVTVYAKWLLNNYEMQFDTDEGSTIFPQVVSYGITMTAPEDPTKPGYTFGGWYLNATFTQAFVEGPMPAHDVTLYAKWNVNSYTLQFLDYDGAVIWSDEVAYETDLSQLSITPPSRAGYVHSGWSTVLPTTMPMYNVTLTAVYQQMTYFITYYSNGGTSVDAWSGHYGDLMPNAPVSERIGYSLEGWYLDESLTVPYSPSTMTAMSFGVFAKWAAIEYTITYQGNGGDTTNFVDGYTMDTLPVELEVPTRNGYVFEGWYSQSDLSGDRTDVVIWPQVGDLIYYAKWSPLDIPVSYYLINDVPEGTLLLAPGEEIAQLSAGLYTTLILTTDHRVIGWGYNTMGALGPSHVDEIIPPFDMTPFLNLYEFETPTRVIGGFYNSFIWTNQNRVIMFGSNMYGELAVGVSDYDQHPYGVSINGYLPLLEGETISQIESNFFTMAVLTSHHRLFTWGMNETGKVGDGTVTLRLTPYHLTPSLNLLENETLIDIDMGTNHMIVLSSTGRVWTWGLNTYGQLGNGTTERSNTPIDITSFIPLTAGDHVREIAAGATHNVMLTTLGKVITFGNNATGELATTDLVERKVPTDVTSQFPMAVGETITSLSTGEYHNAILTSHHRMLLWGTNAYGMQGDGTQVDHTYPVEITALVSPDIPIASITTGGYSSMALLEDGTLRQWGHNLMRLLDLDGPQYILVPTTHHFVEPAELIFHEEIPYGSSWIPYEMSQPGYTFSGWYLDQAMTEPYVIGLKDEHPLALYGQYEETVYTITFHLLGGSFGDESQVTTYTLSTPYVVYNTPSQEGHTFEGWYTTPTYDGEAQTLFQPTSTLCDFDVYAKWSTNSYQLSYLITEDANNPRGIPLLPDETIVNVEYGFNYVVLLTSTGRVFSWGANSVGQLGNGTWTDSPTPVEITSKFALWEGESIVEIATGSGFTIARSSLGKVFTWGFNNVGQLGNGTTTHGNLPTNISSTMNLGYNEIVTKIYAGSGSGFATTSLGRFLIWGTNVSGELGDNLTSTYRLYAYDNTPALGLQAGETISSFSSRGSHTWVVTSNHRLIGWGKNTSGQLGLVSPTTVRIPTDLTSLISLSSGEYVITAASGDRFSLIATSFGRVYTMGSNSNGELGNGTTTPSTTPVEITSMVGLHPQETIIEATFGYAHLLALTSEGRLLGWGRNWAGETGDLTTTTRLQALDVTANIPLVEGESITHLDAQFQISAVMTSHHRVFMWGYNDNYQQLDGGVMDVVFPHPINTFQFESYGDPTTLDFDVILDSTLPVRTGYTFSGWYTDIRLTTAWTGSQMPAHDLQLYGQWTIIS